MVEVVLIRPLSLVGDVGINQINKNQILKKISKFDQNKVWAIDASWD